MSWTARIPGARRCDVAIIGPPRSGTTLLTSLLTQPPVRLILAEQNVRQGATLVPESSWQFDGFAAPADMTSHDDVVRWLGTLDRWGVKEVAPERLHVVRQLEPRHVVLCVRDIRHVALSAFEIADSPGRWAVMRARILGMASSLASWGWAMAPCAHVVRYEDAVTDPSVFVELSRALDWPMTGDAERAFAQPKRARERELHAGEVTDRSFVLRNDQLRGRHDANPEAMVEAERIAHLCRDYQSRFGY